MIRPTSRLVLLVVFWSAGSLAHAQDVAAKLDAVLSGYQKNRAFIGSALIAKGGKVILEKGYGMSNVELDVPNGPDTKFRLGSITKQFTATAILQLEEQGKLSVTDTACKYLPECPETWKAITIHQLLSHTSGIPSYTDGPEFAKPKMMRIPLKPVEILMLTKDKPLEFQPGEKWKYDNSGYIFLGVIVEKVSGEKYADYLKKHIFGVLDMQDSGYDDSNIILKNRAQGYRSVTDGFRNADYLDMSLPYAAGSLYSTANDLYRWDRALYTDKVLSKASREKMWTPVNNDYAYGWGVGQAHQHKQIAHGGGINGFSTFIARYPDDDAVVIVLSNNERAAAGAIAGGLSGILFGDKVDLPWDRKEVSIDAKILDRYVGSYQAAQMTIAITSENGQLMIEPKGQGKLGAIATSETEFFVKQVDATLTFTLGPDDKATELRVVLGGSPMLAKRVP
jgi:CubicO group peptidase (beta-lactamase class C family)